MNRRHLAALIAERTMLRSMIDEIPAADVMDRGSLLAKLETIESQIAAGPTEREPAKARLTFVGRPVIGSHGIFADFGMKAVNGFAEAVAAVAASLTAPLRAMGPRVSPKHRVRSQNLSMSWTQASLPDTGSIHAIAERRRHGAT